jgi:hypothetical protein
VLITLQIPALLSLTSATSLANRRTYQTELARGSPYSTSQIKEPVDFHHTKLVRSLVIPMTLLQDLPEELLRCILAHIPRTHSKTLHSLSLTCRAFQPLTEEALYREIRWVEWTAPRQGKATGNYIALPLLLRTLLLQPRLAAQVRLFEYCGSGEPPLGSFNDKWLHQPHEKKIVILNLASWAISKLGILSIERQWLRALSGHDEEDEPRCETAFIALILLQLQNLKFLFLSRNYQCIDPQRPFCFSKLIKDSLGPVSFDFPARTMFLRHLVSCEIDPNIDMELIDEEKPFTEAEAFFYLPSIERLRLNVPHPGIFFTPWWPGYRSKSLKSLRLDYCSVQGPQLESALEYFSYLTSFTYDFIREHEDLDLDCDQLCKSLKVVKGTLRELSISVSTYSKLAIEPESMGGNNCGVSGSIGSLKHFEMLCALDIPHIVLFGADPTMSMELVDILPKSIRHLGLYSEGLFMPNGYRWTAILLSLKLNAFLLECKMRTPLLRSIVVEQTDNGRGSLWPKELRTQLQMACSNAGISLRWTLERMYAVGEFLSEEDLYTMDLRGQKCHSSY